MKLLIELIGSLTFLIKKVEIDVTLILVAIFAKINYKKSITYLNLIIIPNCAYYIFYKN